MDRERSNRRKKSALVAVNFTFFLAYLAFGPLAAPGPLRIVARAVATIVLWIWTVIEWRRNAPDSDSDTR